MRLLLIYIFVHTCNIIEPACKRCLECCNNTTITYMTTLPVGYYLSYLLQSRGPAVFTPDGSLVVCWSSRCHASWLSAPMWLKVDMRGGSSCRDALNSSSAMTSTRSYIRCYVYIEWSLVIYFDVTVGFDIWRRLHWLWDMFSSRGTKKLLTSMSQ